MVERLKIISAWVLVLLLVAGPPPAFGQPASAPLSNAAVPTLAPILKQAMPGVVNVAVQGKIPVEDNPLYRDPFFRRFFDLPERPPEREFQSMGSGVIIDSKQGFVLTNNHVIDKADRIIIGLHDGRRLEAKLIGADPESDIALLRVPAKNLTALPLGSSEKLEVGDYAVAIGNPFGLGQTVTSGIVSALSRSGLGIEGYEDFIQTDAAINPGNSGGALINLRGELIGINTAIVGPSGGNVGIGFAIPIDMAREIVEQIQKHGKIRRGVLGVTIQDLPPELAMKIPAAERGGAQIMEIMPRSAAEKAKLRKGEVIVSVNGKPVRNATQLRNRIGLLRVGQKIEVGVVRDGKPITVTAKVEPRDS